MPFIHPVIFWVGLGCVSAPILIHLLNRRRFRMRDWAAMQFLLDSLRKNRRRLRIEELILMAIRCLVILLLALAVARYTGRGLAGMLSGSDAPTTTVFVLDDSYSMGRKVGGSTIFSAAATDLIGQMQELAKTGKTDQIAIVLTSKPEAADPFFKLTRVENAEIDVLAQRLRKTECSDGRARLAEAIEAAERILADTTGAKRVFIFSDFCRVDLSADRATEFQTRFDRLREQQTEVVTLDYGRQARSNLTLEKLELLDKFAIAKHPVRVAIMVRNNGTVRAENVRVAVSARSRLDDELVETHLPEQIVRSIDPGASARIEFRVTLPQVGSAAIKAELPADDLPGDNAAHLALDVRKAARVLIVDGRPEMSDPTASESFRAALAVDPRRDGTSGNEVTVTTVDALEVQDFSRFDVVMLLSVPQFASSLDSDGKVVYPKLAALEYYVRAGGGLAIFTGGNLNLTFYNGPMYADGLGLSPLVIRPAKGDPLDREKYFRLDPRSIALGTPVLKIFTGEGAALTTLIRFFAFTPADPLTASPPSGDIKPPRILARFTDPGGSPAVVARQFGAGAVVMVYTTASTRWNDWGDDVPAGLFVTPVQDLIAYLARSQDRGFTATVGQPITRTINEDTRDAEVTLQTPRFPADDLITLAKVAEKDRLVVRSGPTRRAGCYCLRLKMPDGSAEEVFYARNPDPVEGDLAPGGKEEITTAFGSAEFQYVSRRRAGSAGSIRSEARKEYWIWALAALLAMLAVETYLARRFGHYS